jgi:uncharacterized protein
MASVRNARKKMSERLYSIYEKEIPSFLNSFLDAPSIRRIDHVGMHCGMEYTSFPFYKDLKKYSRMEHSLGVSLIIHHFSGDIRMSLSGLFHDIATPSFAHVIDFLHNDHEKQESTEERTADIIKKDKIIQKELKKRNIQNSEINDYHIYPIADNDSPKLSADRLEYTLHNFYNYGFASLMEIKEMYDDLVVSINESGEPEIMFRSNGLAEKFTLLALKNGHVYTTDEDRYAMEYLAHVLHQAIERKIITEDDLYLTEEEVISRLMKDEIAKKEFQEFRNLSKVIKEEVRTTDQSYKVRAKKRYIDPMVKDKRRISSLSDMVKKKINDFLNDDFDYYLRKA